MPVSVCSHCHEENPCGGGYCWLSPDGQHDIFIDEDGVNPYDCCPFCGAELDRAEIDGFAEHVCDPADLTAQEDLEEESNDGSNGK
jgi:hypothetical protein